MFSALSDMQMNILTFIQIPVMNIYMYADLGRFPSLYYRKFALIKYWRKLLNSNNCILLNCYYNLFNDVENNKKINWVSDVKNCLIDVTKFGMHRDAMKVHYVS